MARIIFALTNIGVGLYAAYWGWTKGGVYLPTVFFIGCVMAFFGMSLLLIRPTKKKDLQYKDVYNKED